MGVVLLVLTDWESGALFHFKRALVSASVFVGRSMIAPAYFFTHGRSYMSISAEEKDRYLRETAIVLARERFHTDRTHTGGLRVLLDGAPLCEVTENGGITYRNEDINEPERIDAKDKVYEIVRTTAEYMRQIETAPFLKADGLEDGYKVLADFNGTVLAGVQSKHGVHFVTWDWAYGHTGESQSAHQGRRTDLGKRIAPHYRVGRECYPSVGGDSKSPLQGRDRSNFEGRH